MRRTLLSTVPLAFALTVSVPLLALAGGKSHGDHPAHGHTTKVEAVDDVERRAPTADETVIAEQLPTYPLDLCLVSGQGLDEMGEPVDMVHEGRLGRLCCSPCKEKFDEE